MNRWEIANELCRRVRKHRMGSDVRFGMAGVDLDNPMPLEGMTDSDQYPWLEVAEVVGEILASNGEIDRVRALCDDWQRFTVTLAHDPKWCNEMRRSVVVELRHQVGRLSEQCKENDVPHS